MWIWALLLVPGTAILYKVFRPKDKKIILRKPEYKKDLIYLMQFPVSPTIRSISPFSIKLETFLRLKKIPYEPVYCRKFDSKKRYIPYIELNGEQMSDSNLIIQELEKRGIAKPDENLSEVQKSVNHLATVTVENHTAIAGFHWRYGYNMPEFLEKLIEPYFHLVPGRSLAFFRYLQPYIMVLKTKMHGLGRHSLSEIAQFSFKDLDALSLLLGEKTFFNGEDPSTIDCTLFGHLVQFVYMPLDIPQKQYIQENCPNLELYVDRIKNHLWPDWDEMCRGSCMEGKTA